MSAQMMPILVHHVEPIVTVMANVTLTMELAMDNVNWAGRALTVNDVLIGGQAVIVHIIGVLLDILEMLVRNTVIVMPTVIHPMLTVMEHLKLTGQKVLATCVPYVQHTRLVPTVRPISVQVTGCLVHHVRTIVTVMGNVMLIPESAMETV